MTSPANFWSANSNALNAVVAPHVTDKEVGFSTPAVLWVDQGDGSDVTGIRGRKDRPYASIQAALAACFSGDTVRILPGTYALSPTSPNWALSYSAALHLSRRDQVTIEGVGVVTLLARSHGVLLAVTDCSDLTIRGLRFVGLPRPTATNSNYYGLLTFHGVNYRPRVYDCYFQGGQHGILHGVRPNRTTQAEFRNNLFRDGGNEYHLTLLRDGAAIAVGGSGNRIQDNTIINWTRGIEIEGGTTDAPSSTNIVSGNLIMDVLHEGIVVLATTGSETNYAHLTLSANQIGWTSVRVVENPPSGIFITGGSDLLIEGNNIRNMPNGLGIMVTTGHAPARRISISDNRVSSVGSYGVGIVGSGSRPAEDVVVADNHLTDVLNTGIFISASRGRISGNVLTRVTASDAIRVSGACQDVMVTDNQIDTCTGLGLNVMAGAVRTTVADNWGARLAGGWYVDSGTETRLRAPFINADSLEFGGVPAFALRRSTSDAIFDLHGGAGFLKGASIRLVGESRATGAGGLQLFYGGGTPGSPAQDAARLTINRVSGGNVSTEASAWEKDGSFTHRQAITLWEIPTPTAPAPNSARLFLRDNGSGRSQLAVLFPNGTAVPLATEAPLLPSSRTLSVRTASVAAGGSPAGSGGITASGVGSSSPPVDPASMAAVGPTHLWLDVPNWMPVSGSEASPVLHTPPGSDISQQAISFEPGRTDHIQCKIALPAGWEGETDRLSVTLYWCASAAGDAPGGDVRWSVRGGLRSPAEPLAGSVLGSSTTVAASATGGYELMRTVLEPVALGGVPASGGQLLYLDLARLGADPGDTLGQRVFLLGAQLVLESR